MTPFQQRLLPDSKPLVERLGRDFFRQLPERPGVYLMYDATAVLYVGKAKNLRHRLGSYRVANPERMARRTLRLLHLVQRIVWEECDDENAALNRESELLLSLKPRFNRAGKWKGPDWFLAWKESERAIQLIVTEAPEEGWSTHGPLGAGASYLAASLARLLWLAVNQTQGVECLPVGWMGGRANQARICGKNRDEALLREILAKVELLRTGDVNGFRQWFENQRGVSAAFEQTWLDVEFESLSEWFT